MFPYTVIHITSCLGRVLVPQWIIVNLISAVDLENMVRVSDVDGKHLEIIVNGTWGTVCEVGFTDVEVRVRLVHTDRMRMQKKCRPHWIPLDADLPPGCTPPDSDPSPVSRMTDRQV